MSKFAVLQSDVFGTHDGGSQALRTGHFVIITGLLLLLGGLLAWWMVVRADREMRADLLSQTSILAQAVNIERVSALTGTRADLAGPEYLRLKDQLAAVRQANPQIRFLYLLGRNTNGKLFFYVDSEPADSKDYSPPGQVYEEAAESYREAFSTSTAAVVGPATDRWGTWVSALVPLQEHQTARQGLATTAAAKEIVQKAGAYKRTVAVRALLCMDVDARAWHVRLVPAALPPILLALILCAILWTGRILLRRRFRLAAAQPRWMRHLEPVLAIAAGLTLTLFFAWMLSANELREHKEAFAQLAFSRTEAITKMLLTLRDTELEGLAQFYGTGQNISAEKFRQYSSHLTKNQSIAAWEWIPEVPAADKERFTSAARAAGLTGFEIWQKDTQGKRIAATGRALYYPVYRVAPLAGNEKALGYDLGSDSLRHSALALATHTGLTTSTEPITLVQETGNQKGMLIYRPVFGENTKNPRGFALAVLRMGSLLQSGNPDKTVLMDITLLRKNAPAERIAASWDEDSPPAAGIYVKRPIFAFGKTFAVTAHAGPEFEQAYPMKAGLRALWTGLLLTACFAVLLHLSRRRREELELLVAEQTTELRDSENFQRMLLSNLPVGIVIVDPVTRIIEQVNIAAATMFGAPAGHIVGKRCHSFLCPASEGACPICDLGKEVDNAEKAMLCADGGKRPVLKSVKKLNFGGQEKLLECFVDITDRKQAEDALKESNSKWEAILAASPDGIGMVSLDGKLQYVSDKLATMFGYSVDKVEELLGNTLFDFIDPTNHEMAINSMGKLLAGETMTNFSEYLAIRKDNSRFYAELKSKILFDASGKPANILFIGRDITEHKQAAEKLAQLSTRLTLAAKAGSVGVWDYDTVNNVLIWDEQMFRLYGITADQFSGAYEAWRAGLHPEDMARGDAEIQLALLGEKDFDTEFRVVWPDGTIHNIRALAVVQRAETGKPLRMIGTNWDITAQKQAEQALLDSNLDLQESIVKADMANRAKSEFLANMSHELRTPMNGVIGMNSLLLDTSLTDEQRRYAETVRSSGESLLALLNDILDFSKIEAKKLDLESMDFDLRVLLDDFAAVQALRAHEKGLEFICWAAPDVPSFLRGDPGRLRQILVNLAGNAVKFTHQGEIAVRVSLLLATDNDVIVRFSIKDTGIGIPADKQGMLFQKFTQVDASVTRKYGGTGLGLAISKQLSEMMGGEIGLISQAGQGSEFWFTARFARQTRKTHEAPPLGDISGMHILVVDDNATNREVLLTQLANWGVVAEEAVDGLTALEALHGAQDTGKPFVGAILDMQMPGMNGAELAMAIKADDTIKNTRLILMTSMTQRGDAKRMEEIGFAGYLTKPARQTDIYSCLAVVLSGESIKQSPKPLVTRHTIREMRQDGVRILLAEDNIINQQVAIGILKNLRLRVDSVANGSEAVEALKIIPYDLVLMDCMMPEMDGYEATQVIRDPRSAVLNSAIPIIAMTANAMQGDREKCLAAGMNDYVAKPVDAKALGEALEKWLPKEKDRPKDVRLKAEAERREARRMPGENGMSPAGAGWGVEEETARRVPRTVPAHSEPDVPIFDLAGVMDRLMGDEELLLMLIEGFLDDVPKQIAALRGFLATGDVKGTERQAHTLKGASVNLGGEALRALAFEMEKEAKTGNLQYVTDHLPELEAQFERLKEAMSKFANK